jgi:HEAT repeat protein
MRTTRIPGKRTKIRIILAILASTFVMPVFGHQGQQRSPATEDLLRQFLGEKVFWKQLEIGKKLVAAHDTSVLNDLAELLKHEDRHLRGNAAFVFARLGDERGFAVITAILEDRSDRPEGQGQVVGSSDGRYHVAQQIRADRYYAAHLLGDIKDRRAIPILVKLLRDEDVRFIVPWALSEIGDKDADRPLIDALNNSDPSFRVYVIQALEKLGAREALPKLRELLGDQEMSRLGVPVSVSARAKAAIAKLEAMPQ